MKLKNRLRLLLLLVAFYSCYYAQGQVVDYKTDVTVSEDGEKTTTRTIRILIKGQEENDLAHIELNHNPKQAFTLNYARILDKENSVVRKLKKKDTKTVSDRSYGVFYQDDLITEFDLYWSQYPYQIEYSYTIVEHEYISLAHWTPILFTEYPTLCSKLQVTVPEEYELVFKMPPEIAFEDTVIEQNRVMTWSAKASSLPEKELFAPTQRTLAPFVEVLPTTFTYGTKGSYESWATFGMWKDALNRGTDNLPESEQEQVKALVGETTDKHEIIKRLYHYLQDHTTYIYVGIGIGGLKSYPASYVAQNKYGDCKALTTYMKALLNCVGIESYYSAVNSGTNFKRVDVDFQSNQFDHVILCVPLEQDTVWLENTSNTLPFNYLGTFTQNRFALSVNGEKSQLIKTPTLYPEDVLCQREYTFNRNEQGDWESTIALTLRGDDFEDLRDISAHSTANRLKREITDLIHLKGFNLEEYAITDIHRDSLYIQVEASGSGPKAFKTVGEYLVAAPLKITLPKFEKPTERKLDVYINFPINQLVTTTYPMQISTGRELILPEETERSSKYGFYKTTFEKSDEQILATEHFILYTGTYSLKEYAEFYTFLDEIKTYKKKTLILIQ